MEVNPPFVVLSVIGLVIVHDPERVSSLSSRNVSSNDASVSHNLQIYHVIGKNISLHACFRVYVSVSRWVFLVCVCVCVCARARVLYMCAYLRM